MVEDFRSLDLFFEPHRHIAYIELYLNARLRALIIVKA